MKTKRNKVQAVSYLRCSGLGQVKGDSFPRQREAIAKYAKSNKIEIVEEFVEKGVSGDTEGFDRPALQDMIHRLKSNGVRLCIVENSGRLARDLIVSQILKRDFRKHGIKIVDCAGNDLTVENGGDDTDQITKKLISQIMDSFYEFEKNSLVAKLKCARKRIRKAGKKCEGRPFYGEAAGEEGLIDTLKTLRTDRRLKLKDICIELDRQGYKPRHTAGTFTVQQVSAILNRNKIKKGKGISK